MSTPKKNARELLEARDDFYDNPPSDPFFRGTGITWNFLFELSRINGIKFRDVTYITFLLNRGAYNSVKNVQRYSNTNYNTILADFKRLVSLGLLIEIPAEKIIDAGTLDVVGTNYKVAKIRTWVKYFKECEVKSLEKKRVHNEPGNETLT